MVLHYVAMYDDDDNDDDDDEDDDDEDDDDSDEYIDDKGHQDENNNNTKHNSIKIKNKNKYKIPLMCYYQSCCQVTSIQLAIQQQTVLLLSPYSEHCLCLLSINT